MTGPVIGFAGMTHLGLVSGVAASEKGFNVVCFDRPDEETVTLAEPDPTWAIEYQHFKKLCERGENNIANDIWINETLRGLQTGIPGC